MSVGPVRRAFDDRSITTMVISVRRGVIPALFLGLTGRRVGQVTHCRTRSRDEGPRARSAGVCKLIEDAAQLRILEEGCANCPPLNAGSGIARCSSLRLPT